MTIDPYPVNISSSFFHNNLLRSYKFSDNRSSERNTSLAQASVYALPPYSAVFFSEVNKIRYGTFPYFYRPNTFITRNQTTVLPIAQYQASYCTVGQPSCNTNMSSLPVFIHTALHLTSSTFSFHN
jgi:hypothetical protein